MTHPSEDYSNVYFLDRSKHADCPTDGRGSDIRKPQLAQSESGPDYDQLVGSMQLLRNELRAAEASLGLFQQEVEQSIADSLQLDFTGERRSNQ